MKLQQSKARGAAIGRWRMTATPSVAMTSRSLRGTRRRPLRLDKSTSTCDRDIAAWGSMCAA
jgi:hypothetical protein